MYGRTKSENINKLCDIFQISPDNFAHMCGFTRPGLYVSINTGKCPSNRVDAMAGVIREALHSMRDLKVADAERQMNDGFIALSKFIDELTKNKRYDK